MRLLIIEDSIELASLMKAGLEEYGFQADVASTGLEGEEKAYVTSYDCILLDLNLPDKDGIEILKFLRSSDVQIPVVIITARDQIEEKTLGLDQGADDYITKPFQMAELRARIHAVIRRYHGRSHPLITIGCLQIHPASRKVYVKNQEISLSAKEFDILEYIAERHPAVVSAEEIVEHVYDEEFDPFSSVLRVHLTRLRKKLRDGASQELLANIRGKGYYLCVD